MSLLVKRKEFDPPTTEELEPKRKRARPLGRFDEESDGADLQKALRLSRAVMERPAVLSRRAIQPLICGRFQEPLTSKHQEIHELILQHFQKTKTTRVTGFDLRRMCLPKDPATHVPKDLRIVDVPELGKGVFLSRKAKPIKARDTLGVYEGTVQLIYKGWNEKASRYKWTLFDFDLEEENGTCPDPRLNGWSEIVDGERGLGFTALINACHPDHPEEANVEPRLVLLKSPDQSMSVQMLYVASRAISAGEQLLINYGEAYFENLAILPLRITPLTYTLNDQDLLASSSSSSSRSSSTPLIDEDDYKELSSSRSSSHSARSLDAPILPPRRDDAPVPALAPHPLPCASPALILPPRRDDAPVPALAPHPFPCASPALILPPLREVSAIPVNTSQQRRAPQVHSAWPLSKATGPLVADPSLTLEEVNQRIEKMKAFLLTLNLICEGEIGELRIALQTLDFPERLFNTFYEMIKRALSTPDSGSDRDIAVNLREKLYYFIKILWGKEGSVSRCFDLLYSAEAPLWWLKTHSHFVKIFIKRENCHRPPVHYVEVF